MVSSQRAQLVLVGAVVVAVAVLGAVALLNTIHSSPEASAQTDTQSVADAENALTEIENDLGKLAANRTFTGPRGPLRFVGNDTELQDRVEAYEQQYLNLSTADGAGLINVKYDDGASTDGAIGYNESVTGDDITGNTGIVEDTEEVRFYLEIEGFETPDPSPENIATAVSGGPNDELQFTEDPPDSEITGWGFDCDIDFEDDVPFEIEIIGGDGEIRSSETGELYCNSTFSDWDDVEAIDLFNFNPSPNHDIDASYEVVGVEGECSDDIDQCLDNVVVSPVFDITFQNPNVAVDSKITLWDGS